LILTCSPTPSFFFAQVYDAAHRPGLSLPGAAISRRSVHLRSPDPPPVVAARRDAGWRDGYRFAKPHGKPTVKRSRKSLSPSDFCNLSRRAARRRSESVHRDA
jgi:hypothetical protein